MSHDRKYNDQQEKFEDIKGVIRTVNHIDRKYNDQQEKFEDIKGVIRTVTHMTGITMTNKKSLKI
jgi:5-methylcytosine-specific restriction endonuclease McrBC regulatory subunit McrC